MNTNDHKSPSASAIFPLLRGSVCVVSSLLSVLCFLASTTSAATFHGNADLTVSDPTGALSWNSTNNALSVQCWFKISIPSGTNLTQNMVILANGTSGPYYAYLIRFNIANGNVEFVAQGSSGGYTNTLIQLPYLERWYHLAIAQQGSTFTGYVDGRQVFSTSGNVGNTANTSGISIGGWGNGQYLYGEVQEVSIYQKTLSQDFIVQYMFDEQPTNDSTLGLVGYFPIDYSTNFSSELANFAPAPIPSGAATASQQGSGTVTFEEADEGGEQSAFDAQRNGGRDALVPLSGAFSWQQTAFSRPTPGIAFDFRFGYSSANNFGGFQLGGVNPYSSGPLGAGWRSTFETRVIPSQYFSPLGDVSTVGLMRWDGSIETWDADDPEALIGSYHTRNEEYEGEFAITATNCQWTTPKRLVYYFNLPDSGSAVMRGRLTSIHDFNGNSAQILWNQTSGVVTQVVDTVSGRYSFQYAASGLLTNVSFGSWQVNFAYNATNQLISKTLVNTSSTYSNVDTAWQFGYGANGLLAQIIDPRGNTNVFVQYDQYGRQTNEVDALGRTTATLYETPGERQITHIDPGANSWIETYDRKGNLLAQEDPLGNTSSYTYDTNGNRTSITEPLGWTTYFGYDSRGNVIASTNALGLASHWIMDAFFNKPVEAIDLTGWTNFFVLNETNGDLISNYDALGTLVSYTYSTNGLVLSSTDANGHSTSFSYDTNGFLDVKTDSEGNVTGYGYNDVGWKLAETNALHQVTAYAYDLDGDVVQTVDPINRTYTKTYDGNGNLLSASDGKGQLTTYAYDAANQKVAMTNRASFAWTYAYTPRGKLQSTTDPLGDSVTQTYDAANRLVAVTDPLGNTVTNIYDADGNVSTMIDQLGQRWSKTYDRLDRVVASTDPQGNVTKTSFDADGRVSQITSPNGYPTIHSYDGRGRLVKWVDAQNFPWLYAYDGVGNITNITDVLGGHYIMVYGACNERVFEENQDSNVWHYAYDPLLRLHQQTDPNGITRTYTYDGGGRVLEVDYNTRRVDGFTYDRNDNPIIMSRSGSGPVTQNQLSYDSMDRVVGDTDTFGNTNGYSYDAVGRRHTLTYPDGKVLAYNYDALNRLTNQVDWAGRQMNYSYDKAGRLLTRTYPNSIVQSNAFDNAGHIIGLNYVPPNPNSLPITAYIALTYAYDHNGNKTISTEQGTLHWPMPSLHNESSSYTPTGKLTTRTDALSTTNNFTYQYDASGNMTNAVSAGESYALTYDEDNHTMSIQWTLGALMNETISNRYDVLGRRVSKTAASIETRYALDLGGGMERVLCDMNASGAITAWYVYGPDLCYKADATNSLTCYHSDAIGNVIAMTDGNTNLISEYAYTPYGRNLCSTNFPQIPNPYKFVGSQGVMEDLPDLYFMRARYYSADASTFLSTDPIKHIGPGWMPMGYQYAGGNPMSRMDPNGQLFGWDDAIFLAAGAIAGAAGTIVGDVVNHQQITFNGVVAGAVGGAVNGEVAGNVLELTGNPIVAGAAGGEAGGAASYLTQYGLSSAEGKKPTFSVNALAGNIVQGGVEGALSGGLSEIAPIPRLGSGQGNIDSQLLQLTTKQGEGLMQGISLETAGQQLTSQSIEGVFYGLPETEAESLIGKSFAATTANAWSVPQLFNWWQGTPLAFPTIGSGTTTTKTTTQSSGGGAFATTSTATSSAANNGNQVTQAIQQSTTSANTSISSAYSVPPEPGQNVNRYRLQNLGY